MSAIDAVDGSSTGIAMHYTAVRFERPRMSPLGTFQPVADPPIYDRFQG